MPCIVAMFYNYYYTLFKKLNCTQLKFTKMTQEKANKIFDTDLGQQLLSFYTTSDDQVFIRYNEAVLHTNEMVNAVGGQKYVDTTITEWFPK